MKKLLTVFSLCAIVLAGCGGNTAEESQGKKLHVLTSSGYAPYEMRTPDGKLEGFDIDLTEAIAKELGYEGVEWEDLDFDALIGAIGSGRADMAAAGLSPDEKRKESVDFSDSYYSSSEDTTNFVLTLDSSGINKTEDIKGKKVGVQIGTIQESAVNSLKDEYNLTLDPRKSYGDMVQEIKNKRIDFMVVEKAVAEEFQKTNPSLKFFQLEAEGSSTGNCFAFKKGNKELVEKVNGAIKKLQDNGELQKLIDKWFKN